MITSRNFLAIRFASSNPDSEAIQFLIKLAPYTVKSMISSDLLCHTIDSYRCESIMLEYVQSVFDYRCLTMYKN